MVSISQVINQNHAPNRCHMFSKTEIQGVLKKKKVWGITNCVHWISKTVKNNALAYLTILALQTRAQPGKLDSQLWLSASEADQP